MDPDPAATGMGPEVWNARYAAADLVWSATPNQWVESELRDVPPGRALDLACGEGRNAIWLASLGWDVTAVDFAVAGLTKGRTLQASRDDADRLRIVWLCADVVTWAAPLGSFDLALLCYLQLPADQRRAAVRHAASSLAPGGLLLVVGHDTTNLTDGVGGPPDPRVLFTAADVVADLASQPGLQVERAERVDRIVQTGDGPRAARDALVRVRRSA